MLQPLVSIIIPNYNHAAFLEQRLDSVFNQTFQDFEVILLDDCSTDSSIAVLKKYAKHPKVAHLVFNKENSGSPFKQWEKGIELVKGSYIWVAESDDYCEYDFLESLLDIFEENMVLAYSATKNIDEINNKVYVDDWATGLDKNRWKSDYINEGGKEIATYFRYRNIIPNASSAIFKKSAINQINLPIHMRYCGDWYIWIELLKQGNIGYIRKPLNCFRKHSNTTRVFKLLAEEKYRFKEYFSIIHANSNLSERLLNLRRYDWILLECFLKKRTLGNMPNIKLKLPLEFQLGYYWFLFRKKIGI